MKFMDKYCRKLCSEHEIDDYIEKWHESGPEVTAQLHEYLGMTWEEFGSWVGGPNHKPLEQLRAERKV